MNECRKWGAAVLWGGVQKIKGKKKNRERVLGLGVIGFGFKPGRVGEKTGRRKNGSVWERYKRGRDTFFVHFSFSFSLFFPYALSSLLTFSLLLRRRRVAAGAAPRWPAVRDGAAAAFKQPFLNFFCSFSSTPSPLYFFGPKTSKIFTKKPRSRKEKKKFIRFDLLFSALFICWFATVGFCDAVLVHGSVMFVTAVLVCDSVLVVLKLFMVFDLFVSCGFEIMSVVLWL